MFFSLQVVLPATYILIGPVQLAVTCYLLWDWLNLGPACVTSLLILFLMFPVQVVMGRLSRILRYLNCYHHILYFCLFIFSIYVYLCENGNINTKLMVY